MNEYFSSVICNLNNFFVLVIAEKHLISLPIPVIFNKSFTQASRNEAIITIIAEIKTIEL